MKELGAEVVGGVIIHHGLIIRTLWYLCGRAGDYRATRVYSPSHSRVTRLLMLLYLLSVRTVCFTIENISKRFVYPTVVYCGATCILAFAAAVIRREGGLPLLTQAEKHNLIEKPLTGVVFESVARFIACSATNTVCV